MKDDAPLTQDRALQIQVKDVATVLPDAAASVTINPLAQLALNQTQVNFGQVAVGSFKEQSFTLTSSTSANPVGLNFAANPPFSFVDVAGCGLANSTCTFKIRFAPTAVTGSGQTPFIGFNDGIAQKTLQIQVNGQGINPGTLVTAFGTAGKVTADFGNASRNAFGSAMVIQPDKKVVVAGKVFNGSNHDIGLARFNSDGTPDLSFGSNGSVKSDLGADEKVSAVGLMSDGSILVAGSTSGSSGSRAFALAQFSPAGTLLGSTTTAFGSGDAEASAMAIDSANGIVLAGTYTGSTLAKFAVAKYRANRTADTSFNTNGRKLFAVKTDSDDRAIAVAIQKTDQKIIVAGTYEVNNSIHGAVIRLNTNGSYDTSFNGNGMRLTSFNAQDDEPTAMTLQPDGKIVLAVSTEYADQMAIYRINTNGNFDSSFGGGDGRKSVDFGSGSRVDKAKAIAIQEDGKIVIAGLSTDGTNADVAIGRVNADGTLDDKFIGAGTLDGRVLSDLGSPEDSGNAVAIQSDGKLLVGGSTVDSNGVSQMIVLQYFR
ncbi:MAG: hypothetical protein ABL921_32360, partial [Pirellula sp.]